MHRQFRALVTATALATPFAALAQVENYTLDPYHTHPHFVIEHFGVSMLHGRFDKTTGKFNLDRRAKTGSVELVIETASVSTGDNERGGRPRSRDEHLRQADFFNVAEFPRMTFKSTKVGFAGDLPRSVEGNLTLLGVTRPVTLTIESFRCAQNPFNKQPMCGGNAVGRIKRSDFGMKAMIPMVGDDLALNVVFEGYKD